MLLLFSSCFVPAWLKCRAGTRRQNLKCNVCEGALCITIEADRDMPEQTIVCPACHGSGDINEIHWQKNLEVLGPKWMREAGMEAKP